MVAKLLAKKQTTAIALFPFTSRSELYRTLYFTQILYKVLTNLIDETVECWQDWFADRVPGVLAPIAANLMGA